MHKDYCKYCMGLGWILIYRCDPLAGVVCSYYVCVCKIGDQIIASRNIALSERLRELKQTIIEDAAKKGRTVSEDVIDERLQKMRDALMRRFPPSWRSMFAYDPPTWEHQHLQEDELRAYWREHSEPPKEEPSYDQASFEL